MFGFVRANIGNVSANGCSERPGTANGGHARTWPVTNAVFGGFVDVDIVRVVIVIDEESLNSVESTLMDALPALPPGVGKRSSRKIRRKAKA